MKIDAFNTNKLGKTDNFAKVEKDNLAKEINKQKRERDSRVGKDYKAEFSDKSIEMQDTYQKALKIALETSPEREDKVKKIKQQIEAGEYKLDAGKVADGILKEAIRDHLAIAE